MSKFQIKTKNQFKETTRYLQKTLSHELSEPIKLSIIQEAVSRSMGYNDMQHYVNVLKMMQTAPTTAEYANGDIVKEIQSLNFLIKASEGGHGTARYIRSFLLHMYNSSNPIEMYKIRNFDKEHKIHMLNAYALDSRNGKEIQDYIDDGYNIFHAWAEEAHEDREYSKHKDNIYSFCESVEKIQNFLHEPSAEGKDFVKNIFNDWKSYMKNLECSIAPVNIKTDGLYIIMLSACDQYKYKYSVCVRFNFIDGLIYVCEESDVNEFCESRLMLSVINQEEIDEMLEYGNIYLGSRNYFK